MKIKSNFLSQYYRYRVYSAIEGTVAVLRYLSFLLVVCLISTPGFDEIF